MDDTVVNFEENTVSFNAPGRVGRVVKMGDIIGTNYRLKELLGQGGMGVVYRCEHIVFGQDYAMKILSPDLVNDVAWERFQIEGQAIAKLEHRSIVKIFNMGVEDEICPYYVMEILDGKSLDQYLAKNGPMEIAEALPIFYMLAEGLGFAHGRGIIHRDVKPSNVVLQPGRGGYTIKIVDFGLAKVVKKSSFGQRRQTNEGEIFGSPYYISPEQGRGEDVDERADIYSMGCTMFKTLTGKPPFKGANSLETIALHLTAEAPSLGEMAGGRAFPQALEEMVAKMMAKDPDHRYGTMDQVAHDIGRLIEGKTLAKSTLGKFGSDYQKSGESTIRKMVRPSLLTIAALSIFSLTGLGVFSFMKSRGILKDSTARSAIPKTPLATRLDAPLPATPDTQQSSEKLRDKPMESAIAIFKGFNARPSTVTPLKGFPDGIRTYYFPDVSVGILTGRYPVRIREAQGSAQVEAKKQTLLQFQYDQHHFTYANPWILKKLDGTGITHLIFGGSVLGIPEVDSGSKSFEQMTIELLDQVKEWPDLFSLDFRERPVNADILKTVAAMPKITELNFVKSDTVGKDLAESGILGRLQTLRMDDFPDCDPVIRALAGSKNLTSLDMKQCSPSAEALEGLASCPNLTSMSMGYTKLSAAQIAALGALTHLRQLHVDHVPLSQGQMMLFTKFKAIKQIYLSKSGVPDEICDNIHGASPNVIIEEDKKEQESE